MKSFFKYLLLTLPAFLLGAGIVYYMERKHPLKTIVSEPIPTVDVIAVTPQTATTTRKYIGYVTPINQVAITPFINGYIEQINVSGGQFVQDGDLLFVIEQDTYLAELDLSRASVLSATARYENDKMYYDRLLLAGNQAIPPSDLDKAKTQFLASSASLIQAVANQKKALINYDYTMVYAPISGKLGDINLSVGDYVSPASGSLIEIIQTTPIRVMFSISDKEYLNEMIHHNGLPFYGSRVKLLLANGMLYNKDGKIVYINNRISPETSSIVIWAEFENPQNILLSESYVTVLIENDISNVLLIPKNTVYTQKGISFVYVVDETNVLQSRKITIDATIDGKYLVSGELRPTDKIVIGKAGIQLLGKKVSPTLISLPKEELKEPLSFPNATEETDDTV